MVGAVGCEWILGGLLTGAVILYLVVLGVFEFRRLARLEVTSLEKKGDGGHV